MTATDRTDATAEEFDATLARFEAAPAAPESFDPIAAVRRVEALADLLDEASAKAEACDRRATIDARTISNRVRETLAGALVIHRPGPGADFDCDADGQPWPCDAAIAAMPR